MKKITKMFALALALVMALSLSAGVDADAASKVTVKKVKAVNKQTGKKTITLAKGKKATIKTTVTVTPNKKANKKVTYKTNNKKVATVSKKGVITAKAVGSAKITVVSKKNKKKKATIKVKVVKGKVTKVSLDKKTATVDAGKTVALKATVKTKGKKPNKTVKWTTNNKAVATVSSKGVVTGKKAGTAKITATATDGTNKKATCTVTVKAAAVTPAPAPAKKYNTQVKFNKLAGETVNANVTVSGNAQAVENYAKEVLKTYTNKKDHERTITVDGVAHTVKYVAETGALVYDNDAAKKITDFAKDAASVTATIDVNAYNFVTTLDSAKLPAVDLTNCSITIGDKTVAKVSVKAGKVSVNVAGTDYVVTAKAGVLTIEGNHAAVINKALSDNQKKYVTVTAVEVK